MLSPKDIANSARKSGYDHVNSASPGNRRPDGTPYDVYWRAAHGPKPSAGRPPSSNFWRGPTRQSVLEAAQDYCDYINGLGVAAPATLKSANHGGKRKPLPMDEDVQEALGILRDAKAARRGKQGFVYLIGEQGYGLKYAKIGFSTNPEARMGELQTGNPRKLVLLGKMKGTEKKEAALHAKHIKVNVMQEWFVLTPEIKAEFVV